MVVVLGLVLTGSVLSGWRDVGGRDGQTFTVRSYRSSCSVLPVLGGSLANGWMVLRCDVQSLGILDARYVEMSWLRVAEPDVGQNLCLLWQEEALGGRDGDRASTFTVVGVRLLEPPPFADKPTISPLCLVPRGWANFGFMEEALDDPAFLDDSRLLRARADVLRSLALRVASEQVVVAEATQLAVDVGGRVTGDTEKDTQPAVAAQQDQSLSPGEVIDVQLSTYTCVGDGTGAYCPGGTRTASGTIVHAGGAACDPEWMGDVLEVGRFRVTCEDTGSAVHAPILEFWCYSWDHWGSPGTPEYDQPCPAICEWQDEAGRCFAQATVMP